MQNVIIGGIKTVVTTRLSLAQQLVTDWRTRGSSLPKLVFSSNGEGVARYATDPDFRAMINAADIVHADGMSIVFASRLTKTPLPERIATTDFFHDAARVAVKEGLRFYFLGATAEENAQAVAAVRALYPSLQIAGARDGFFSTEEEAAIISQIVASGADVLWLALGRPRQEAFALKHKADLAGVTWVKTCGGLFKFLAGKDPRAPEWMQKSGMEWLFRLYNEPKRLFWRYLSTNVIALWRLVFFTHTLHD